MGRSACLSHQAETPYSGLSGCKGLWQIRWKAQIAEVQTYGSPFLRSTLLPIARCKMSRATLQM